MTFPEDLISEYLHLNWLRLENVVWDTKAATLLQQYFPRNPSLDFGSGNGLTMFTAAGGQFSIDFDWYIDIEGKGFLKNKDIYDKAPNLRIAEQIIKQPDCWIDIGFDHKINLLKTAEQLNCFYKKTKLGDGQKILPFRDRQFKDVYSNIIYWMKNPGQVLTELQRIIQTGGRFLTCCPTNEFYKNCDSYNFKNKGQFSKILKLVNRGRADSIRKEFVDRDLIKICVKLGFRLIYKENYLAPITLKIWDVGCRPLSPLLIKMANSMSKEKRAEIKKEWCGIAMKYIRELWELEELAKQSSGGFAFMVFEKK